MSASKLRSIPGAVDPTTVHPAADLALLTIGTLAAECGVTVRTLRYYEEMDLLGPVKRSEGKYRLYNHQSIKRVKAIMALQDLGYSLEAVLVALGAFSERKSDSKAAQIETTRQSLLKQRDCVDGKLTQLKTMRKDIQQRLEVLDSVCNACVECKPAEVTCPESCEYLDVHD